MTTQDLLDKGLIFKYKNKEGYYTKKYLDLNHCTSLTSLPDNLKVGSGLDLNGCTSLTSLPDNLKVGRGLDLRGCTSLRSLPDNLEVGGNLWLEGGTLYPFDTSKFSILGDYKIIQNSIRMIMED